MMRVVIFTLVLIAAGLCEGLRVGAFNIQVFGKTKFGKQEVVKVLSQVSHASHGFLCNACQVDRMRLKFKVLFSKK